MTQVFNNGFITVEQDDNNGFISIDRNATQHGSIVVPITSDNKIVLIREYRHGAKQSVISFVKGAADNNEESYEDVAARELKEELGMVSSKIIVTHSEPFALASLSQTRGRICFAFDCEVTSQQSLEDGEQIEVFGEFTINEIWDMIISGKMNDAESIAAFAVFIGHIKKIKHLYKGQPIYWSLRG